MYIMVRDKGDNMNKINKNLSNARSGKSAFTLAEVLITLAIIGVIAALVMPFLITSYQKRVVENKLKKFYSTMNQALKLSAVENGDLLSPVNMGRNYTYQENLNWLYTYILPHIKYSKIEKAASGQAVCVYLGNGDGFKFSIDSNGADLIFVVNLKDKDLNNYHVNNSHIARQKFNFQFFKRQQGYSANLNSTNFIEPYIYNWDGSVETLKTHSSSGCKKSGTNCNFCTKLIQLNGWKIPADYPW